MQTLDTLGSTNLDYLFLNAGMNKAADAPGVNGSKWCEPYVVNSLSQHYLTHLLREKLVASHARIVFVSSGAVRNVPDPSTLAKDLKAQSGAAFQPTYCNSKFAQLLTAHWWRGQLSGQCDVVAVSPGLIPDTGLARDIDFNIKDLNLPDAKDVPTGARSMLAALTKSDFPEDPERIFLTSWGEWWPKDVYGLSLDRKLQEEFSPSKEEIEREELVD